MTHPAVTTATGGDPDSTDTFTIRTQLAY